MRIDSAVHEQAMVQPYYDSVVAKLIVHADTRERAIRRMMWALDEFVVEGIRTTMPLQQALLMEPDFKDFAVHTRYVDTWLEKRKQKEG